MLRDLTVWELGREYQVEDIGSLVEGGELVGGELQFVLYCVLAESQPLADSCPEIGRVYFVGALSVYSFVVDIPLGEVCSVHIYDPICYECHPIVIYDDLQLIYKQTFLENYRQLDTGGLLDRHIVEYFTRILNLVLDHIKIWRGIWIFNCGVKILGTLKFQFISFLVLILLLSHFQEDLHKIFTWQIYILRCLPKVIISTEFDIEKVLDIAMHQEMPVSFTFLHQFYLVANHFQADNDNAGKEDEENSEN